MRQRMWMGARHWTGETDHKTRSELDDDTETESGNDNLAVVSWCQEDEEEHLVPGLLMWQDWWCWVYQRRLISWEMIQWRSWCCWRQRWPVCAPQWWESVLEHCCCCGTGWILPPSVFQPRTVSVIPPSTSLFVQILYLSLNLTYLISVKVTQS